MAGASVTHFPPYYKPAQSPAPQGNFGRSCRLPAPCAANGDVLIRNPAASSAEKKTSFSERQARAQQLQQHAVLGAESLLPPGRMLATVARAFLGLPWLQPGDECSLLGRGLPAALRTAEPLRADPRKTSATTLQPPHATATLPQERMQITPFFVVFLVLKTGHYLMTVWSTICYYTATLLPLRHSKGCSWQDL